MKAVAAGLPGPVLSRTASCRIGEYRFCGTIQRETARPARSACELSGGAEAQDGFVAGFRLEGRRYVLGCVGEVSRNGDVRLGSPGVPALQER